MQRGVPVYGCQTVGVHLLISMSLSVLSDTRAGPECYCITIYCVTTGDPSRVLIGSLPYGVRHDYTGDLRMKYHAPKERESATLFKSVVCGDSTRYLLSNRLSNPWTSAPGYLGTS